MFDLIVILIPLFPLLAMLANGLNVMLGHRYSDEIAHRLGWGSVLLSFLCALWVFGQTLGHPEPRTVIAYRWFFGGELAVNLGFLIDPLTCVMMLVVTGVGFLIHVYSVGYMHGEEGFTRFFAYMNLFMVSMLLLVMGNNYAVLFIGWEGVGLCSYLLIGYYYDRVSAAKAATKAFVVNRIGDAGFLIAIFLVFARFGTLDYTEVFAKADTLDSTTAFAIAVCLLIGAVGKSAQLGLHTWLPDAMEGPTPVSALIHAATMVTAGVYMVARLSPMFEYAPTALAVVGVIGGTTAVFAASVGMAQNDIKRVIAYSTCSQLGYMFFAAGVSAYGAAMFHLFTHAFFKALLFLGAGSVIHAMSAEQDMRRMGGLWNKIPYTYAVMWIGSLSLAGIPFFAGYYSKDTILAASWASGTAVGRYSFCLGIFTAFLTAFYSWRLLIMTFHGKPRADEETMHHVHESPWVMLIPLFVLAAGAAVAGYFAEEYFVGAGRAAFWKSSILVLPGHDSIGAAEELTGIIEFLPLIAAVLGIATAYLCYSIDPAIPARLTLQYRAIYLFLLNKWYFDELYDRLFVKSAFSLGDGLWKTGDGMIIDGLGPDGIAAATRELAREASRLQTGYVYHYAFAMLIGVVALVTWYLLPR